MTRNHTLLPTSKSLSSSTIHPHSSIILRFLFEAPNHYDALWQHHGLHFHHLQRRRRAGGRGRGRWRQGWCGDGRCRHHWRCYGRRFRCGGRCSGCCPMPTGRPRSTRTGGLAEKTARYILFNLQVFLFLFTIIQHPKEWLVLMVNVGKPPTMTPMGHESYVIHSSSA